MAEFSEKLTPNEIQQGAECNHDEAFKDMPPAPTAEIEKIREKYGLDELLNQKNAQKRETRHAQKLAEKQDY